MLLLRRRLCALESSLMLRYFIMNFLVFSFLQRWKKMFWLIMLHKKYIGLKITLTLYGLAFSLIQHKIYSPNSHWTLSVSVVRTKDLICFSAVIIFVLRFICNSSIDSVFNMPPWFIIIISIIIGMNGWGNRLGIEILF